MKIGLYIPTLDGGGAQRVALNLARGLISCGCNVNLILVKRRGGLKDKIPTRVGVINLNSSRTLSSIPKLAIHLCREEYDALISFMNYANICTIAARLISGKPQKVVVTEHNTISRSLYNKSDLYTKVRLFLTKVAYIFADNIVAVSEGVSENLKRVVGLNDIQVIHNPIDVEGIDNSKDEFSVSESNNGDDFVLLGAGRITTQKDFSSLIRALGKIREKGVPARLVIIGEGDRRKHLEKLVSELGLKNHVRFPGFVDNPYKYMGAADVFVLSSRWEGFGNVLVEAMAARTAVVSTDCPNGPAEILKEGRLGHLVPIADYESLAEAVINTLENPPASPEQLRDRAEDFSPEIVAKKYLRLVNEED